MEDKELKKESKTLTVGDTKIGVTIVLHKADCVKLGFSDSSLTRDVISSVKKKLGLVV